MIPRHEVVDKNFKDFVLNGALPQSNSIASLEDAGLNKEEFIDIFESQIMSRQLDIMARVLKASGESFYTIGSSGHEGNAAIASAFRHTDMAFLHYRSGAFFIQRSKQLAGTSPLFDLMLSLVASKDDPISAGRHKVLGSVALHIPPQTSTIASHLPKAVGCAMSIPKAKHLKMESLLKDDSIVFCNFGDASFNHASAQSAINSASMCSHSNVPCPIVFVCEDNGIGISVRTPENWISAAAQSKPGIKYFTCDGRSIADVVRVTKQAVAWTRKSHRPSFLHMKTVRLLGHAGSDVESLYRTTADIEQSEKDDPLLHSAKFAIENHILTAAQVIEIYTGIRARLERIAEQVVKRPKLMAADAIMNAIEPTASGRTAQIPTTEEQRQELFGFDWRYMDKPHHMAKLINFALTDIMARYKNALIFGEDVARKGGVYNVTKGLLEKFGLSRVFNTILDETSILGTAIGMGHNGFLPIPEIQFLAYVHNAEDQIRGEAATLSFFSNKQFTNPMVIRIAGLAYQKGFGGHFHNDNSLAVFRDIPGLVVACPSNGVDAVKMLRRCARLAEEEGRVVVFIEPIALYMTKDLHETGDGEWTGLYPDIEEEIEIGEIAVNGTSEEICIITYGNGFFLSCQAAKELSELYDVDVKIIDYRWIAPLNEDAIVDEIKNIKNVLIVDECRKTGSQSEAIVAAIVEKSMTQPNIRRLCAEDSYIPLGAGATVVLPSKDSIVAAVAELLHIDTRPTQVAMNIEEHTNG